MKFPRILLAVAVGGLAIGASGTAMAGLSVGVNLGAPVYAAPAPVYAPPPPVVYQPAPVYAEPSLVIGWHGDRYWDGRRYWDRDDWYHHHGRAYGYDHHDHGDRHWH